MNHFTDRKGWNGIRATLAWRFRARKQQGGRPTGAYFTTLFPTDPNFYSVTRVPVAKRKYRFTFVDVGDLQRRRGPLGRYVLYSPTDYVVEKPRQQYEGPA
jgi:hypothetical protein